MESAVETSFDKPERADGAGSPAVLQGCLFPDFVFEIQSDLRFYREEVFADCLFDARDILCDIVNTRGMAMNPKYGKRPGVLSTGANTTTGGASPTGFFRILGEC